MGADFIVPFREESKERARKALFHWCLTVLCFLQQLCYRYRRQKCVKSSVELVTVVLLPWDWCLV